MAGIELGRGWLALKHTVKRRAMKPSMLLAVMLVTVLSACTGGNPTSALTAPSQQFGPTTQLTQSVQPTGPLAITLAVASILTANQPTTFVASTSSSANATLDFGDGSQVAFDVEKSATLKHVYNRSGTFVATFTATNTAGDSASIRTTLVMR